MHCASERFHLLPSVGFDATLILLIIIYDNLITIDPIPYTLTTIEPIPYTLTTIDPIPYTLSVLC